VGSAAWFPNGYPSDLIKPDQTIARDVDVGFCGSLIGNRDAWLTLLESKFRVKRDIFKLGNEMVKSLSSYKIAFNINIADDINFRTFESTGAGALLMTNYTPNIEKLFKLNEEIVIYENPAQLVEKIEYFLQHDDERVKISKAGLDKSRTHHSYDARSASILNLLSN
jgi:spore maturation protein CgeB